MPAVIRPAMASDIDAIAAIYAYHVNHSTGTFETEAPDSLEMTRRFASIAHSLETEPRNPLEDLREYLDLGWHSCAKRFVQIQDYTYFVEVSSPGRYTLAGERLLGTAAGRHAEGDR